MFPKEKIKMKSFKFSFLENIIKKILFQLNMISPELKMKRLNLLKLCIQENFFENLNFAKLEENIKEIQDNGQINKFLILLKITFIECEKQFFPDMKVNRTNVYYKKEGNNLLVHYLINKISLSVLLTSFIQAHQKKQFC